jgi:hypothetical protein
MARFAFETDIAYRDDLTGILSFATFAEAEKTVGRLQNLCRKYQSLSDKKGMEYCRQIASLGRKRADLISRNKRVSLPKRMQKQEIATWFKIWLETPAIFEDWLAMRKNTDEFRRLLESESVQASKSGESYAAGTQNP